MVVIVMIWCNSSSYQTHFVLLALAWLTGCLLCALPAQGQSGRVETKPAPHDNLISITTYVPGVHLTSQQSLAIVCEVTNGSNVPIRILTTPRTFKVRENEISADAVEASPAPDPDAKHADLAFFVEAVYPRYRELRGRIDGGHEQREFIECVPGKTVLIKLDLGASLFEPGDCKLFVALRGAHAGTKNVAIAKPVALEVVPPEGKKAVKRGRS
jgi:hypothetical protein